MAKFKRGKFVLIKVIEPKLGADNKLVYFVHPKSAGGTGGICRGDYVNNLNISLVEMIILHLILKIHNGAYLIYSANGKNRPKCDRNSAANRLHLKQEVTVKATGEKACMDRHCHGQMHIPKVIGTIFKYSEYGSIVSIACKKNYSPIAAWQEIRMVANRLFYLLQKI